jgi:antitoxin ParD1/3/4
MANSISLIGEYFESYIEQQVKSGKFSSSGEVMRAALRLFEKEENKTELLINELKVGEKSGMFTDFNRNQALSNLHSKYLYNEV